MSKGKFEKASPKHFPWMTVTVASIIVFLLIFVLKGCDDISITDRENTTNTTTTTAKINQDSIAIPGYEGLTLKANSKKQALCLPNPLQNTCYFQLFLLLEDGTLLWKSELIEPGDNSKPITLKVALEKGTYPNAILRYSCFEMNKEKKPLNGAEIKVTLWVK